MSQKPIPTISDPVSNVTPTVLGAVDEVVPDEKFQSLGDHVPRGIELLFNRREVLRTLVTQRREDLE